MKNILLKSPRQLSLLPPSVLEFGGSLLINKRKSKRILDTKRAIHLISRGDITQSGSLLNHRDFVESEVKRLSEKFEIKYYGFSINSNHFHFFIKISSRENYIKFIRALNGRLAQVLKIKFEQRPYTRIVNWGRQFQNVKKYVVQNHEEAIGQRPYKPRNHKTKKLKE